MGSDFVRFVVMLLCTLFGVRFLAKTLNVMVCDFLGISVHILFQHPILSTVAKQMVGKKNIRTKLKTDSKL